MKRIINFFKSIAKKFKIFPEIINELRKVVWPSRRDWIRLTLTVLALCIVAAIILGSIDYGFLRFINLLVGEK